MSTPGSEQINPTSLILVQEPTFLGIVWTCVGVSFCFLLLRFYVRLRVFRRIFDDDILVLLAWLILLACTILWHVRRTLDLVYLSFYVGYGAEAPPPYYIEHLTNWLRILFAEQFLNIIGLWAIKFSFLAFFRRLGHNVQGQRLIWWIVTVLTIIALGISVGVAYYPCIFATFEFETTFCPTAAAGDAIYRSYRIQFGCDFATDLIIMLVPLKILWKVQINMRQKLALLTIFFLTAVTMVFSLVRVVVGLRGPREDDVWFFFCATIELTIAIMIACIVSYRSFFKKDQEKASSNKYNTYAAANRYYNKRTNRSNRSDPYTDITAAERDGATSENASAIHDGVEVMPLDMIRVKDEVHIRSQSSFVQMERGRLFE